MKKTIAITFAFVITIGSLVWLGRRTYYVQGSTGWHMVCSNEECDLFIEQGYSGWAINGFQRVVAAARSLLFAAYPPTHRAPSETLVLRVTPTSIDERRFPGAIMPIDAYKGYLYVSVSSVGEPCICKWSGIGYQKLAIQEQDALRSAEQAGLTDISNDNQGWSKYDLRDKALKVSLARGDVIVALSGYGDDRHSISVLQPSQKAEHVIWSFDESVRKVDKKNYERLFGSS